MASAVVLPMSREVKNLIPEHSSSTLLELQLRSAKKHLIIFLLIPLDKKYYNETHTNVHCKLRVISRTGPTFNQREHDAQNNFTDNLRQMRTVRQMNDAPLVK